ncbi:MAG TPA: glycosyltransferase [Tepidisphaeraceae bacterium]|nr:glycosyltransferase [Tepidisphaeraceae bacterium]
MGDRWVILTGEYPPQPGGVSDYTRLIAKGLAAAGDEVHVWAPPSVGATPVDEGVRVHRLADHWLGRGRRDFERELLGIERPYRVLVQYVPQAFGCRGMNLGFALMLRRLARRGAAVWVMFHEVVFPLQRGAPLRHNVLGIVTRVMARIIARNADRLFVSIEDWRRVLTPMTNGRPIDWLPVPSNVAQQRDDEAARRVRERIIAGRDLSAIIGHFGSCDGPIEPLLRGTLQRVLSGDRRRIALLIGRGGDAFRERFIAENSTLADQVVATGDVPADQAAAHIAACDLLVQPYIDGISCRRSSAIAGLALGTPVVSCRGHLTEAFWASSGAMPLAETPDVARMAELVERFIGDQALRASVASKGSELYAERFHPQNTIDALTRRGRFSDHGPGAHEPMVAEATTPLHGSVRPIVVMLVNGDDSSAMGIRARSLSAGVSNHFDIRLAYRSGRKIQSMWRFFRLLRRTRPAVTYVLDMSFSGVLAACAHRLLSRRNRLIIDTGDAIYELAKSMGRGRVGLMLTWALEHLGFAVADHIVVRGSYHRELLEAQGVRATFIPDGVDVQQFARGDRARIRRELGIGDDITLVGIVGSCVWNDRLQMCYGWELIELLHLLKDQPVHGILVGDGSGIAHLQQMCRERGVDGRLHLVGRVPYEQLPDWLAAMDICLSTQTNDVPGRVRTTGKLPLYLAAGRYVLATRVGEAARVLPEEMLVEYEGVRDSSYPIRLERRIRTLLATPASDCRERCRAIAQETFDYQRLSERAAAMLGTVLKGSD